MPLNSSSNCYIVQKRSYDHHNDEEGRLEILGCYHNYKAANKHAKAEAKHLAHVSGFDIDDFLNGSLYAAGVRMCEEETDRVLVNVKKEFLQAKFFGLDEDTGDEEDDSEEDGEDSEEETEDEEQGESDEAEEITPPLLEAPQTLPTLLPPNTLSGFSFAFAGIQKPFNRAQLSALITRAGGKILPIDSLRSVHNNPDIIIMGTDVELDLLRMIARSEAGAMPQREFVEFVRERGKEIAFRGRTLVGEVEEEEAEVEEEEEEEDGEGLQGASRLPTGLGSSCLSGLTFAIEGTQKPLNSVRLGAYISGHGGTIVPLNSESHKTGLVIVGIDLEDGNLKRILDCGLSFMSQDFFLGLMELGQLKEHLTMTKKRCADAVVTKDGAKRQETIETVPRTRAISIHDLLG